MNRTLHWALGLLSAVTLLSAPAADAYKFLCNGMTATGEVRGDGCGACGDSTAARWMPGTVPVRVDYAIRPNNVSASHWQTVFADSLQAWNGVSGSNLVLQEVGTATTRGFGTGRGSHEIYWITNANEWASKVGGGGNGVLGVTVPASICGNPREIVDADLAMNGFTGIQWAPTSDDCTSQSCISTQSVLVHELGHFVGLGHPCIDCNWANMAATAAYQPDFPLFDDQEGLRALYPGQPGGIGYGCGNNSECDSGLCAQVGDLSYCSQTCGTCPTGFECNADNVCAFSSGSAAGAVGEGESCAQRPCEDGLLCAGDGSNYTCYRECTTDAQCSATQECFALQGGGGVCVDTSGEAQRGERCSGSNLCASGLICIGDETNATCRGECDADTDCFANESCFPLQNGGGACFPAGNVQEGGVCNGVLDCARGHLCVNEPTGGSVCYRRCDAGYQCQIASQTCQEIGSGYSVCTPLPGQGGGNNGSTDAGNGGNGGNGGSSQACNPARGNWDCDDGAACVQSGNGYACVDGQSGSTAIGELCTDDADCDSGLCDRGVCTRPCDESGACRDAYECVTEPVGDRGAVPGGLCRAESCLDDPNICPAGWECQYSSAKRNVCAKKTQGCLCAETGADPSWPAGGFALAGLAFMLMRRRR